MTSAAVAAVAQPESRFILVVLYAFGAKSEASLFFAGKGSLGPEAGSHWTKAFSSVSCRLSETSSPRPRARSIDASSFSAASYGTIMQIRSRKGLLPQNFCSSLLTLKLQTAASVATV